MDKNAHSNPKSFKWIISLVVMIIVSVAVIFGSSYIYDLGNKKYNEKVAVDFQIAQTEDIDISAMNGADLNVTACKKGLDGSGNVACYIVSGTTVGYNQEVPIEMETVISPDGEIVYSIDILKQEETEYLGVRIQGDEFKSQFDGRYLPVVASTDNGKGSKIDVLSKSTISSKAVVDGVNNAQQFVLTNFVTE